MANYKPYGHEFITVGGVSRPMPHNANLKMLISSSPSTTGDSFHDIVNDLIYTPLTGKAFTCYGIIVFAGATPRSFHLYESVTADASAEAEKLVHLQIPGNSHIMELAMDYLYQIDSGDFLTCNVGTTSGSYQMIIAIGVEHTL